MRGRIAVASAVSMLALSVLALSGSVGAQQQDPEAALRLLADGERLEQEGDLAAALRNYALLVQQFPTAGVADDALLRIAQGNWRLGDRAAAQASIARLQADYPRTEGTAGAFVLEGNILMATSTGAADLVAAREAFRNVVLLYGRADFPALDWRARALVRAGQASVLLGEPEDAAAAFLSAIEDESHSLWTDPARLYLAEVLMRSGQWAPAAEMLQRIINESVESRAGHEVDLALVAKARRRMELGYRLLMRPAMTTQPPWSGARQVRFTGPQLDEPIGIDASEDNRVVIVDPGVPLIAVLETDGTLSSRVRSTDAFHPWWGPDGFPYVSTKRSVLNPVSQERQSFSVPENNEMKLVENITAGAHGIHRQWLVVDTNRKHVLLFDDNGDYTDRLIEGDFEPVDVTVDYLGNFYVLDRRNDNVVRFSPDGAERQQIIRRDWRRPEAIASDGLGNLYVLDRDAKQIDIFNPQGQLLWTLGPQLPGGIELRSPRDLGVDGSGRIYVADRDMKAFLVLE